LVWKCGFIVDWLSAGRRTAANLDPELLKDEIQHVLSGVIIERFKSRNNGGDG
jgi:hypothetical protein